MSFSLTRSGGINKTAEVTLKYSDIPATATTANVETISIPIHGIVKDVTYVVDTEFDGGATSELTIQIGDGVDPNGYITAKSVHVDGTAVLSSMIDGAYLNDGTTNNTVNGKQYAAADTIDVLFTVTGANTSVLTSGSLRVIVHYLDIA